MTFEQEHRWRNWLAAVDAECWARVGCSREDLADVDYSTMFEDGVSPKSAARRAIRNANE